MTPMRTLGLVSAIVGAVGAATYPRHESVTGAVFGAVLLGIGALIAWRAA